MKKNSSPSVQVGETKETPGMALLCKETNLEKIRTFDYSHITANWSDSLLGHRFDSA